MRILLVEDEAAIALPVRRALAAQGYEVQEAADLTQARMVLQNFEPDLAILDVRLPEDESGGFTLAREMRSAGSQSAVLFLTARDTLVDRLEGLDLGGDDYLTKPFHLSELLSRVRALLRRVSETKTDALSYGPLQLDLVTRQVQWRGQRVVLGSREYDLLERLARTPGRVYSPEELLDLVWAGRASDLGVVKVCVHHLRGKLGPEVVRTEARGYTLGLSATP
ncbi:response regulator transcription factor [Deinococcus detaillensis]|uniref:Response regulator transcription factor n=1 Tax=Deinococcus detaillensis TaxID=2592048 RepID=A0A553UIT0_9DEIO|nr:response regulator transcription factor [Deinococcus detaillensis]TSA79931.1 response regulator transcription factor [Deinococcus detaillensis]